MSDKTSYRDILRSSSIMGSANVLEYLVGLLRVKIVAVLLGPSGVGLIGLYTSVTGLLGTATSLGITSSGVREVALAYSQEDPVAAARTVRILRRTCWATGLFGWLAAIALAQLISEWLFDSSDHAWAIALLGSILLLNSISGGQKSILQGQRRIGDIARISVISMLINTLQTISLYYWLREHGIVPVLIATAVVSLGVSFWFSRQIVIEPVQISWTESIDKARHLAKLGSALMISALLTAAVDMATRTLIIREYGIDAAGLYQAAWALSGLFAGFVLSAMGTDFYPRLTSVIHDHALARQTVNEQTEIGILLALPGLLGTLFFAPLVIRTFYAESFLPAAELLPWFLLGVFGRIISWPLGYILLAKGASRHYLLTETFTISMHAGLILWMIPKFGAVGASYAFAITYLIYSLVTLAMANNKIKFIWSKSVIKTLLLSCTLIVFGIIINQQPQEWAKLPATIITFLLGSAYCIDRILNKTGTSLKDRLLRNKKPIDS